MPYPRVLSLEFVDKLDGLDPAAAQARVRVGIEGGKDSIFTAGTFDRPAAWLKDAKADFWFAEPVLYVRKLEPGLVRRAVERMSSELGGYWLRYYRSKPGKPSAVGLGTASIDRVQGGSAVLEAVLKDGREFSMLAATPEFWTSELDRRGFDYYFGPMAVFLKKLDSATAKRAAKRMAELDEGFFTRYDTPRKTVAEVLAEFAAGRT